MSQWFLDLPEWAAFWVVLGIMFALAGLVYVGLGWITFAVIVVAIVWWFRTGPHDGGQFEDI